MKRHTDLTNVIGTFVVSILTAFSFLPKTSQAATTCQGSACGTTWEFPPSIPSSANGDVSYMFEFRGWTTGHADCADGFGTSSGRFRALTSELGTVGNTSVADRTVVEDFGRVNTCHPGGQPYWQTACSQALLNGTTYDPSTGWECLYDDGEFFWTVVGQDWPTFFGLVVPVTETSTGYDSAGNVIWTLDFSYAPGELPGYFFEVGTDCGPFDCKLYSWGWSAYYMIDVWVKQGEVGPTIPDLMRNAPPVSRRGDDFGDGAGLIPPTARFSSPLNGSVFPLNSSVQLNAVAADGDGTITSVKFYDGTTLLHTDTQSPFSYTWNTTGASSGAHTLTAKATDNNANETTSAAITVTLQSGAAPSVSLTAPSANSTFFVGDTITLSASASDSDGTIAKVEFYRGEALIGTDYSSSYSIPWDDAPLGNHSITARTTDNSGMSSVSSSVSISVVKPTVTLNYGYNVSEGNETGVFLTKDSTAALRVWLSLGYYAQYPDDFSVVDFNSTSGSIGYIDIPQGNYNYTIYVPTVDDSEYEGDEALGVTVLPDDAYDIDNETVYLTIYDND